jgi:hypothetical protein
MFGPRITTVFRSKWRAIWFVLSVLASVWLTVPHGGDKTDPEAQKQAEAVAALVRQVDGGERGQADAAGHHVNPWAKTPN